MNYAEIKAVGQVSLVTLNRPQRLNAIGGELLVDLHAALAQAQADPATGCIVLTGAGRAFCAGDDLKEFDQQSESNWQLQSPSEHVAPGRRQVALVVHSSWLQTPLMQSLPP